MFKILNTTVMLLLGGLLALFATSNLMDLMNMPESVAVAVAIVLMALLWLICIPYFLKWIYKRYAAAITQLLSKEEDTNA